MFVEGKKNGYGILQLADGSEYKGQFKNNNLNGHGDYKWPDGKRYLGQWKNS